MPDSSNSAAEKPADNAPAKTLGEVLSAGAGYLARKGVESPRLACDLLAARLLHCKHLELPLRHGQPLGDKHLEAMRRGVKRVGDGEPVQYVLGQVDFMGHRLKVDRRALIPRPETEQLVEHVLQCAELWSRTPPAILDWGTGSGCIAIALAAARPTGVYLAVDTSAEALALARENAAAAGLADRIGFTDSDLSDLIEPATLDAIVANLPYVTTEEYMHLPPHIRLHEPRLALDGGPRGLSVIEQAVPDAAILLKPGGFIFLEIGWQQGGDTRRLLEANGFGRVEIRKDLGGKDRFAIGVLLE